MFISSLSFACWFHSIIFLFLFVYRESSLFFLYIYILSKLEKEKRVRLSKRGMRDELIVLESVCT